MDRPDPASRSMGYSAESWCRRAFLTARHESCLTSRGSIVELRAHRNTKEGDINITASLVFGRSWNTTPPDRNREQLAPGTVQELTYNHSKFS